MARTYRHGTTLITASDGFRLVGGFSTPSFPSPLHLFASSSSADDFCDVTVFGITGDGVRESETFKLSGQERVFSSNKYVFIEAIIIVGVSNVGDVSFSTETGLGVGTISSGQCQLTKASYPYTLPGFVEAYGVSVKANAPSEPLEVRLVLDRYGIHREIHTAFVKTDGGSFEKSFFGSVPARVGDIVSVYAKTDSADVQVSAWVETVETIPQ